MNRTHPPMSARAYADNTPDVARVVVDVTHAPARGRRHLRAVQTFAVAYFTERGFIAARPPHPVSAWTLTQLVPAPTCTSTRCTFVEAVR